MWWAFPDKWSFAGLTYQMRRCDPYFAHMQYTLLTTDLWALRWNASMAAKATILKRVPWELCCILPSNWSSLICLTVPGYCNLAFLFVLVFLHEGTAKLVIQMYSLQISLPNPECGGYTIMEAWGLKSLTSYSLLLQILEKKEIQMKQQSLWYTAEILMAIPCKD